MLDRGFETGLKRVGFKPGKPILYVERELTAVGLLVDKIETGALAPAPIWSDSGTLDCKPFIGKTDAIIGGFPCQPFSVAGQKQGENDERWLWPDIFRLVNAIRPGFVFLENVTGLISGNGLSPILGDLAEIGYDAEWISLQATAAGAAHQRERVFIMAHADNSGNSALGRPIDPDGAAAFIKGRPRGSQFKPVGRGGDMGKPERERLQYPEHEKRPRSDKGIFKGDRFGLGQFAPGPDFPGWAGIVKNHPEYAPVKSGVRGVADGMAGGLADVSKLRILGNGVVPQQAALAFEILVNRINKL